MTTFTAAIADLEQRLEDQAMDEYMESPYGEHALMTLHHDLGQKFGAKSAEIEVTIESVEGRHTGVGDWYYRARYALTTETGSAAAILETMQRRRSPDLNEPLEDRYLTFRVEYHPTNRKVRWFRSPLDTRGLAKELDAA